MNRLFQLLFGREDGLCIVFARAYSCRLQTEREERRAMKRNMGIGGGGGGSSSRDEEPARRTRFEPLDNTSEISLANVPPSEEKGGFNYDDTMTTNLYLGNINPKVSLK